MPEREILGSHVHDMVVKYLSGHPDLVIPCKGTLRLTDKNLIFEQSKPHFWHGWRRPSKIAHGFTIPLKEIKEVDFKLHTFVSVFMGHFLSLVLELNGMRTTVWFELEGWFVTRKGLEWVNNIIAARHRLIKKPKKKR